MPLHRYRRAILELSELIGDAYSFACPDIDVHPDDDCAGLPLNMLDCKIPHEWQPLSKIYHGGIFFAPWGFRSVSDSAMFFRSRQIEKLYKHGHIRPELQFVHRLIWSKKNKIRENDKADEFAKCDYILLLTMPFIDAKYQIKREFTISGGVTLRVLQDKILQSVLGFSRSAGAGYIFIDGKDAAVFGSSKLYKYIYGTTSEPKYPIWDMIDDEIVRISDIMTDIGQKIDYIYDLRDWWCFRITVKKIYKPDCSIGQFRLTYGSGYSPPQRGGGNSLYGTMVSLYLKTTGEERRELEREMYKKAPNWEKIGPVEDFFRNYHPFYFDWDQTWEAISSALASNTTRHEKEQTNSSTKFVTTTNANPSNDDDRDCNGFNHLPDKLDRTACWSCGNPHDLKRCLSCQHACYCSVECEGEAWNNRHKDECERIARKHNVKNRHVFPKVRDSGSSSFEVV